MDSRLTQQLATIRTAEVLDWAATARAARDGRPRRARRAPRVPGPIAARFAHR